LNITQSELFLPIPSKVPKRISNSNNFTKIISKFPQVWTEALLTKFKHVVEGMKEAIPCIESEHAKIKGADEHARGAQDYVRGDEI
jgi:hypothetical protein